MDKAPVGRLDTIKYYKDRTRRFALDVVRLFKALPRTEEARIIGRQFLRSGTSVGANYRAVCNARSSKEFISRMKIVLEESDETTFWLELLAEAKILPEATIRPLHNESLQLTRIFSASLTTARNKRKTADLKPQ